MWFNSILEKIENSLRKFLSINVDTIFSKLLTDISIKNPIVNKLCNRLVWNNHCSIKHIVQMPQQEEMESDYSQLLCIFIDWIYVVVNCKWLTKILINSSSLQQYNPHFWQCIPTGSENLQSLFYIHFTESISNIFSYLESLER